MATSVLVMRSVCLEQAALAVRMVDNSLLLGSSRRIADDMDFTYGYCTPAFAATLGSHSQGAARLTAPHMKV